MRLKLTASKGMSDQMHFVSESDSGLTESLLLSIARPFDYVALLKPRVMSLVIFTAFTGVLVAPLHVNRCSASRPGLAPPAPSICGTMPTLTHSCGGLKIWLAAALLCFTIFFYVAVYTMWLKRLTPQNIGIRGAAGALPPVVGYAAVTGEISLASIALFPLSLLHCITAFLGARPCEGRRIPPRKDSDAPERDGS